MVDNEVWARCGDCETELTESDKECPECGSTMKAFRKTAKTTIGLRVSCSAEHEAPWSTKSYSILAILLALLLGFGGLISYGIWELLPLSAGLKVAVWFVVFLALVVIGWRERYRILMFTRWLDKKSTAKKTYRSK